MPEDALNAFQGFTKSTDPVSNVMILTVINACLILFASVVPGGFISQTKKKNVCHVQTIAHFASPLQSVFYVIRTLTSMINSTVLLNVSKEINITTEQSKNV
jgi:hypothetical protein